MRTCLLFAIAGLAAAQSASTTYGTDLNGNRVTGNSAVAKDGVVTDVRRTINGREVPLEQVQEKVLSKSGNTTVKERLVRHYGADGQLVSTDRVVVEETKTGAGDSTVRSTTYRSDISGNMAEAERQTTETHQTGKSTVTQTAVEKKSLSGSFEVAEKRTSTKEPTSDGSRENETVYRRDTNGNLSEAQRSATTETTKGNQTVSNTAVYEPGMSGQLALTRQNVVTTKTNPDGTSSQEIEVFGRASDARAHDEGAPPSLTEKRINDRQKMADGAIVETQSVQLPSVNNPGRLEPARRVSETVCRGECDKKP